MPNDIRPRLILTVGLPGSGKSTWLRQLGVNAVSTDALRQLLIDDAANQTIHREVFATARYLVSRRLRLGRPQTYVDATNLTRGERRAWIRLAQLHDAAVEAVWFDVPLDVCKARNRRRPRQLPDDIMDMLAGRLIPPALEEGFTRVHVVTC